MNKPTAFDALPDVDKFFLLEYFRLNGDALAALRSIGADEGHTNPGSIRTAAWRMMQRVDIRYAIDEMMQAGVMSALEVLHRHSEIARADVDELVNEAGELDFSKARAGGKTRLIRAVTQRKWWDKGKNAEVTEVRCELHNAQQAQATLAKYHGLLAETIKVKDLPTDRDELLKMLAHHVKRTTGRDVVSAGPKDKGN